MVSPSTAHATASATAQAPGFGILPAPAEVADTDLPDVFERYVAALKDPRAVGGWPGTSCGGITGIDCSDSPIRCVPDLRWGCPDALFLDLFLPPFRELLSRLRHDRFATGQGVYAFLNLGRTEEAAKLVDRCAARASWCEMLQAAVAYDQGRFEDADAGFRRALRDMPEEDACAFSDLHWLFVDDGAYEDIPCRERAGTNDVVWWLSDPLWSDQLNLRRVGHWNRMALNLLHDDFLELGTEPGAVVDGDGHPISHHTSTVRFGMDDADGSSDDPIRGGDWFAENANAFHFVPPWEVVADPFHAEAEDWELAPRRPWELFEDPEWARIVDLPHQVAAFRRGDSLVVVASSDVVFIPELHAPVPWVAALVLTPDPGSYTVVSADGPESPEGPENRVVLTDTVRRGRYLAGIEVRAPTERFAARARLAVGLPEGPDQPLAISDLLFFDASGDEGGPVGLEEASLRMLGRSWVTPDARVGVFWEIYGALPDEIASVELTASRRRGFLGRLGRLIGIGTDDLVIGWSEGAQVGPDGETARSVALDLTRLEPGRYTFELELRVRGQAPVTARKALEVR